MVLINAKNLCKTYGDSGSAVNAVRNVSFEIEKGDTVSIIGRSGSGKSTLLRLIGGLDFPTSGKITVDGADVGSLGEKELAEYRRKKVGFVFQNYNLLPSLSVYDNVVIPAVFDGANPPKERVFEILGKLGIKEKADFYPCELSGGQQQRAAIARALINSPQIILADEPTGNLDSASGKETIEYLYGICREYGCTLVVVTHDMKTASYSERVFVMQDGGLLERTI